MQKRFLLDEEAMGELRRMMRSQAEFCGMEVLTYCFLGNHFHLLVRLDPRATEEMDDAELVRRFRALYGARRSASLGVNAERLAAVLALDGAAGAELRRRLKARMAEVSVFMRELKTRFTLWYNSRNGTAGTFWAERFRSVLVEAGSRAEKLMAAYIDLNPVRANLTERPETYPFCGFGEAIGGGVAARKGLARIEGAVEWTKGVRERYAARVRVRRAGESAIGAAASSGDLVLVDGKMRVFTESVAVGSGAWVERLRKAVFGDADDGAGRVRCGPAEIAERASGLAFIGLRR